MRSSDDFFPNKHVKSFCRVDVTERLGIHLPMMRPGYRVVDTAGVEIDLRANGLHDRASYAGAWINHYYTKSVEEYQLKVDRGRVSKHIHDPERTRGYHFLDYDRNEIRDDTAARFRAETERQISELGRRLNKV